MHACSGRSQLRDKGACQRDVVLGVVFDRARFPCTWTEPACTSLSIPPKTLSKGLRTQLRGVFQSCPPHMHPKGRRTSLGIGESLYFNFRGSASRAQSNRCLTRRPPGSVVTELAYDGKFHAFHLKNRSPTRLADHRLFSAHLEGRPGSDKTSSSIFEYGQIRFV